MASFNFYLKGVKDTPEFRRSTKTVLVSLFVTYQGKRPALSTGVFVAPSCWDFKNQRMKSSATNAASINAFLESFRNAAESILMDLLALGTVPTPEQFKEAVHSSRKEQPRSMSLSEAFSIFIEAKKDKLKFNTLKNYTRNMHRIEEFEEWRGKAVATESYSTKDHEALIGFLTKEHQHSQNTLADMTKTIKSVLLWAKEEGKVPEFNLPSLKVSWEDVPNVYLSEIELNQIWRLDLSGHEGKERARDLFLVGCYTGLRYSDFGKLNPENVGDKVVRIQTEKTGALVTIPIHPIVRAILEKYQGALPKVISNQKMNQHLKDICKLAELADLGTESKTKGGTKTTVFKPKWEMVSTHTARRSFATNIYKTGKIPAAILMKLTGHKTEKAFLKYIKVDQEEAANQLAEMWKESEQTFIR